MRGMRSMREGCASTGATQASPEKETAAPHPRRRTLLVASTALPVATLAAGCASTPLPVDATVRPADAGATARLSACTEAHGLAAWRQLGGIAVAYDGRWRPFIGRIQPELVDAGYRRSSEERLLPRERIVAQSHRGPAGTKHVVFRGGGARRCEVWYDGRPTDARGPVQAAAMVADAYGLFLGGALWLEGGAPQPLTASAAGEVQVDGRTCDVVEVRLVPGLGLALVDRVALAIDRRDATLRRVRFTLEGYDGTRGAVAEVDLFEHWRQDGVLWPTRFYERVLAPVRLPAHDWTLTGLDVRRDLRAEDLVDRGPSFGASAIAPAAPASPAAAAPAAARSTRGAGTA